ncbi:MAG: Cell division protein FtsZ [Candidatus Curtissbacteria bacterium GW2011_GWA1_40_47]|nr:MAG: Cell division protein FtsZ [Candidatus Curtissbacteria bacterium GW2011_GWA1_40_47]
MLIKPDVNRFAKIKVLGIGGGGTNALNSMIAQAQIQGVDFVAVNTDQQHLLASVAQTKVQIGDGITKGLGAGADPEIGRRAGLPDIRSRGRHRNWRGSDYCGYGTQNGNFNGCGHYQTVRV